MCATYASELLRVTADVKAQRGACSSGWSAPPCLAPALLLREGPRAYQPAETVAVLTCRSLFSNYFTHNGSQCALGIWN